MSNRQRVHRRAARNVHADEVRASDSAMQNTEEVDFCTEMLGIAGDFEKRFGTGAKQEIVDDLLVLQSQRG